MKYHEIELAPSGQYKGYVAINHVLERWMRIGENGLEISEPSRAPTITFGIDDLI